MIDTKKTTQEILQEEFLRERAAVLARAGEHLEAAFAALGKIGESIDAALAARKRGQADGSGTEAAAASDDGPSGAPSAGRINTMIRAYNDQLEQVRKRHYELIVTREALGLIHHQRIEEIYRVPPRKRLLPEGRTRPSGGSSVPPE